MHVKYRFWPHRDLYPDQHSFLMQAAYFSNAKVLVGPLGAAWTNLLFANVHCRALSWMPEEKGEEAEYSNIAGILGIDLRYIVYSSGVKSIRKFYNHSYQICPKIFQNALLTVLEL